RARRRRVDRHARRLDLALEAKLPRGVEVVRHRALAQARKAHPVVEAMRMLEARVRPEHEPGDSMPAAPREHLVDQRTAETAAAQVHVEIEAMDLGRR